MRQKVSRAEKRKTQFATDMIEAGFVSRPASIDGYEEDGPAIRCAKDDLARVRGATSLKLKYIDASDGSLLVYPEL